MRLVIRWLINRRHVLVANTIQGCARDNSLRREISTNLVINLTEYGYGTACSRSQ